MRRKSGLTLICCFAMATAVAFAQPPGASQGPRSKADDVTDLVTKMMAFDANKDGKLTRAEVTDERLHRLFDRADADKDGTVTKADLTALGEKEYVEARGGPGFGPPGGGPGFGPPGAPGGFMMGFPRPGEILPRMLQQRLQLTAEQRTSLEALQKEVDAKLEKILNDEQRQQLKEMRERGPGGFGPPGRGGRPGGGPPPGGGSPPPRNDR
jgi:hypothetical protein